MTKRKDDILVQVAKQTGYRKEDVRYVVDALFDVIKLELEKDNDVQYFRFGKFQIQKSRGRHYTLPTRPGEDFYKPPCRYIRFIPSTNVFAMLAMNDEVERDIKELNKDE